MNNPIKEQIDLILKTRSDHVEKFAAAFVQEVGSTEASKYKLVETFEDYKYTWHFEKR